MRIKAQILSQIHIELVPCQRDRQVTKRLFPVTRPQIKSWSTHRYLQCPHHRVRNEAFAWSEWVGSGITEKSNTQHSTLNEPSERNRPKGNIISHAVRTYRVEDGEAVIATGASMSSLKCAKGPEENSVIRQRRKNRKRLSPKPGPNASAQTKNRKRKWHKWGEGQCGEHCLQDGMENQVRFISFIGTYLAEPSLFLHLLRFIYFV